MSALIHIPKASRDRRSIDMSGMQVADWTVIGPCDRPIGKSAGAWWLCRCLCGTETPIPGATLRRGRSRKCKRCSSTIHGCSAGGERHAEYRIWSSMKSRCTNTAHRQFTDYGGRGIRVCEAWADSFEAFFADMGPRPSAHHSLDRFPNNDGNYEPGNCRWATPVQQARNRRNNRLVLLGGEAVTLREFSERTGGTYDAVVYRYRTGKLPLVMSSGGAQ